MIALPQVGYLTLYSGPESVPTLKFNIHILFTSIVVEFHPIEIIPGWENGIALINLPQYLRVFIGGLSDI